MCCMPLPNWVVLSEFSWLITPRKVVNRAARHRLLFLAHPHCLIHNIGNVIHIPTSSRTAQEARLALLLPLIKFVLGTHSLSSTTSNSPNPLPRPFSITIPPPTTP